MGFRSIPGAGASTPYKGAQWFPLALPPLR